MSTLLKLFLLYNVFI